MTHVKREEVGGERRALCTGQVVEKVGNIPESKRSQSVVIAPRGWFGVCMSLYAIL